MERDHLNSNEWKGFRDRSLPAAELLALSDHLAHCPECAARRDESTFVGNQGDPFADDLISDDPYADVAAWVDGTMIDPVDREIFESRLRLDPPLRAMVEDLRAFKAEVARLPVVERGPRTPPSNVVPFAQPSVGKWLYPLAAAAAVVIVTFLGSLFSLSTRSKEPATASLGPLVLPPLAPELQTTRGTLAGASDETTFLVVQPLSRIVRDRRPTLRWTSAKGAESYTMTLMKMSDGTMINAAGLPPDKLEWRPSEPLKPGVIYEWQVSAVQGNSPIDQAPKPPEPEARFQVLDAASEARLQSAEHATNRSALSLGMAYAQAGLVKEADASWRRAGLEGERLRAELRAAEKKAGYLP